MDDDNERFNRLLDASDEARAAVRTHVRLVMYVGDVPMRQPERLADVEWREEYRRLRAAQESADRALDDYLMRPMPHPRSAPPPADNA